MEPTAAQPKKRRIRLTWIITGVLLIAATYVVLHDFGDYYRQIPQLLTESNKLFLALLLALQLLSYVVNGLVTVLLLHLWNIKASLLDIIKMDIGNELGNRALPIAGGIIASYLSYKRMLKLDHTRVMFLVTAWTFFLLLNYSLLFVFSFLLTPASHFSQPLRVTALLLLLVFALIFFGIYWVYRSRGRRFKRLVDFFRRKAQTEEGFLFRAFVGPLKALYGLRGDIRQSFRILFTKKERFLVPFLLSSIYYLLDIVMLYFAFVTFGFHPNIPLLTFGFIISSAVSLVSFIGTTPGITEASYVLILIAFGFPAHITVFAILVFRLISYWIWVPLSFFYLAGLQRRHAITNGGVPPTER